jgi:hypothetical protein
LLVSIALLMDAFIVPRHPGYRLFLGLHIIPATIGLVAGVAAKAGYLLWRNARLRRFSELPNWRKAL